MKRYASKGEQAEQGGEAAGEEDQIFVPKTLQKRRWVRCGCACPCENLVMVFQHHDVVADKKDMLRCSQWHGGCGREVCVDCMSREGPSFGKLCHLCKEAREQLRARGIDTSLLDR